MYEVNGRMQTAFVCVFEDPSCIACITMCLTVFRLFIKQADNVSCAENGQQVQCLTCNTLYM